MKHYEVNAPYVNINSGFLALTPKQYERRKHNLEKVKDGVYSVIKSVQFKRGEQFGYEGDINKSILQDVTPLKEATPPANQKPVANKVKAS